MVAQIKSGFGGSYVGIYDKRLYVLYNHDMTKGCLVVLFKQDSHVRHHVHQAKQSAHVLC